MIYNQNIIDRWTKDCILLFPEKVDLGIAKNYCRITLIFTEVKMYNVLLLNCIGSAFEKILWKNQNSFRRNRSTKSQNLKIRWILEGVRAKNFEATFICRFLQGIWLHAQKDHGSNTSNPWGGLPKENVTIIIMLYKHAKEKIRSTDGDTDFWHCRRCSARWFFSPIICYVSNVDRFNERKYLYIEKGKEQTIPHINYYGRGLRWWHSAAGKYTRIPAA